MCKLLPHFLAYCAHCTQSVARGECALHECAPLVGTRSQRVANGAPHDVPWRSHCPGCGVGWRRLAEGCGGGLWHCMYGGRGDIGGRLRRVGNGKTTLRRNPTTVQWHLAGQLAPGLLVPC